MTIQSQDQAQAVLDFWFDDQTKPYWFAKSDEFDQLIADRFGEVLVQASQGKLDHWQDTAKGKVALIIVLDQFSRNVYRDTPEAFGQDAMALMIAQTLVASPEFEQLNEAERHFALIPYMHSESATVHEEAVKLFARYTDAKTLDFEHQHKVIIDRFGRYPHRNAILGRASSEAELAFLDEPNSSF